jgi:hypothetical protein
MVFLSGMGVSLPLIVITFWVGRFGDGSRGDAETRGESESALGVFVFALGVLAHCFDYTFLFGLEE